MKITKVLFGLMLLLCVACSKSEKETPSGLKFSVLKAGDGKVGKPGEILVMDFQMKDSKDSVWNDTFRDGMPIPAMIADSTQIATEPGMLQVLRMISKGDSIMFLMPFKELLGGRPVLPGMDTNLIITYRVTVRDIMDREQYEVFQTKLLEDLAIKQLAIDTSLIDTYLSENKITAEKSESGLRYVITKPGQGENGKPGQVAKVNYAGRLLDGTPFDSNTFDVTIDQTSVIKGWHETLKLMNKGAKLTVYIPSTLAYGPQGRQGSIIKGNSILVFDMEVVDLK